jgi:acetyl-CoA carboxylase carboxyl transferase subunit beta
MLFHRDLTENLNVCYHCGHHMRIEVNERLKLLFDDGKYREQPLPNVPFDPLKFKDRKKYSDRLRESRNKTQRSDALVIAEGSIGGLPAVVAAMDFSFMGGSMGAAMGDGIVTAAQAAVSNGAAFIVIPTSGGARMQEGMISLMQMPRTIIAAEMVKEAGLPYIVILTDPTTGGVSASFAMVGDIHIAEPGSTIGFAGKRVIQETIREDLPEGFQTAEYLLAHGMVDMVVSRKEMRDTLIRILDLLFNKNKSYKAVKGDAGGNSAYAKGKPGKGGGSGGALGLV